MKKDKTFFIYEAIVDELCSYGQQVSCGFFMTKEAAIAAATKAIKIQGSTDWSEPSYRRMVVNNK